MLPIDITLYSNKRLESYQQKITATLNTILKDLKTDQIKTYVDDIVNDIAVTKSVLSPSIIPVGAKFTAEIYNNTMRGLMVDLSTIYDELDQMIQMFNAVIKMMDISDKKITDKINLAFSKLRSLEEIKTSGREFDVIEYETFVTQSNQFTGRSAAVIPADSGLMRMAVDKITPVFKEANDADIVPVVLNKNVTIMEYSAGNISSPNSFDANYMEILATDNVKVDEIVGNDVANAISYNGIVVAYFIYLPSNRQLNNFFFKPYGDAEFDVLGLYSSSVNVANIYDTTLSRIDITYDTYNYNSYEFNFEPLSAKTLVLLIGQSHYTSEIKQVPKFGFVEKTELIEGNAVELDTRAKMKKLSTLLNNLYAYSSNARTDKQVNSLLASYGYGFNFTGLSTKLSRILVALSKLLYDDTNMIQIEGNLFKVGVYNLSIAMNEYMVDSYYLSRAYNVGYSNILGIQLNTQVNNPSNSNILYDVVINGKDYPIMPLTVGRNSVVNRIQQKDSFTVVSIFNKLYKTRFLADVSGNYSIAVYINDRLLTTDKYTVLKLNNNVAYGINLLEIINPNDVITLIYTIPLVDDHGISYEPYNFSIDKTIDPPHIIDTSLFYSNDSNIVLLNGTPVAGPTGTQLSRYIGYTIGIDIFPTVYTNTNGQYDCWYVPVSMLKQYTALDATFGALAYIVKDTNNNDVECRLFIKGTASIDSTHLYYAGITNESVTSINGIAETVNRYIPGSITMVIDGMDTNVTEYLVNESQKKFVLDASQQGRVAVVSYCPIDLSLASSNIKNHNMTEYFEASKNGALELKSIVYVDGNIVANAYTVGSKARTWLLDDGIFVMLKNSKITYEPIRIRVGNKVAINKTNYRDPSSSILDPYDQKYNNIQYYHDGKIIKFNTDVQDVDIAYYRTVSEIKLKITIINPNKTNNFITPEIYEYALMFDLRSSNVTNQ